MHEASTEQHHIWLLDRRERWRWRYAKALREADYPVVAEGTYTYPPQAEPVGATPELVIVGCTAVTAAERNLVRRAATRDHLVLVLVASLPTTVMRDLFRAGAHDVTTMPVRPEELVALVAEILKGVERSHSDQRELLLASS